PFSVGSAQSIRPILCVEPAINRRPLHIQRLCELTNRHSKCSLDSGKLVRNGAHAGFRLLLWSTRCDPTSGRRDQIKERPSNDCPLTASTRAGRPVVFD